MQPDHQPRDTGVLCWKQLKLLAWSRDEQQATAVLWARFFPSLLTWIYFILWCLFSNQLVITRGDLSDVAQLHPEFFIHLCFFHIYSSSALHL